MIVIRKLGHKNWMMTPHPQTGNPHYYATGNDALEELKRLLDLWPQCNSYDDFIDNKPDLPIKETS